MIVLIRSNKFGKVLVAKEFHRNFKYLYSNYQLFLFVEIVKIGSTEPLPAPSSGGGARLPANLRR